MISSLHAKKFRMLFEQNIASNITRNHVKPWTMKPPKTRQNYTKTMQNQSKICKILGNHSEQLFGTYRNLLSLKKTRNLWFKKSLTDEESGRQNKVGFRYASKDWGEW